MILLSQTKGDLRNNVFKYFPTTKESSLVKYKQAQTTVFGIYLTNT